MTKKEKIRKLLQVSGAHAVTRAMNEWQLQKIMDALGPLAKLAGVDDLQEKMTSIDTDDMLEKSTIPAWDELASEEMLDALIEFYESPMGQKLASIAPELQVSIAKNTEQYTAGHLKPGDDGDESVN